MSRANGTGSLSKRKTDGAIVVRITLPNGRRRKRVVPRLLAVDGRPETPTAHRRRAEAVLREMLAEVSGGRFQPGQPPTVAEYATGVWLESQRGQVARSTWEHYRMILTYYVVPHIGTRRINEVTSADVEAMDAALFAEGKARATRVHARSRLAAVLRRAQRDGWVSTVATDRADSPRPEPVRVDDGKVDVLTADQVRALLAEAKGTRWEPVLELLGRRGLRRGEALGLGWDAIDLDAGVLHIRRNLVRVVTTDAIELHLTTPKTKGSRRDIKLGPALVDLLRRWKAAQAAERLAVGAAWSGSLDGVPLAFTDEIGRPLHPDALRRVVTRCAAAAGLGNLGIHPHRLRHSAGSIALSSGVPVTEVSKMLGHANPGVTMSIYAHGLDLRADRVVDAIDRAIG